MSPPVGVQLLGTVVHNRGFPVQVFDTRLQSEPELLRLVEDFDPHVIGLSFLSPCSHQAIRLAKNMRDAGRCVVAGGVHASIYAKGLLESGAFDVIVRREGEQAIGDICDALARGDVPPAIIVGKPVADMNLLPVYAPFECYERLYRKSSEYSPVYLQLGRGCPMKCTFCELPNRDVFEPPRRRFKSIDRVMLELHTYVDRWRVNFVGIVDSIATLNLDLITELVRRMDAEMPHVGLMFNGHVNRFSPDLARQIGAAQSHRTADQRITVWFGFESGSQRLLDFMRKETTVADGVEVSLLCRQYGVQLGANLLLGVPTETANDYARHDEFMAAISPTFPNPNILNPLPGTQMYDYCAAEGLLRDPTDYSIWSSDKIRNAGQGPLRNVDYGLVVDAFDRYRRGVSPAEHRHRPWAEQQ